MCCLSWWSQLSTLQVEKDELLRIERQATELAEARYKQETERCGELRDRFYLSRKLGLQNMKNARRRSEEFLSQWQAHNEKTLAVQKKLAQVSRALAAFARLHILGISSGGMLFQWF